MFAAKIVEPGHFGYATRITIVVTETRSQRDRIVRYVNEIANEFGEFVRECPGRLVPSYLSWYYDTKATAITMRDARAFIADDDPIIEDANWCSAYDYVRHTRYSYEIHPSGLYAWKDGQHYYRAA